MIVTRAVAADLKVRLGGKTPSPSPEVLERVATIWEAEKSKRGKALFNGSLFSIDSVSPTEITGWLAEYRWFLAQRRDPALRRALCVHPLGVTGVLCCADGVVLGRRAGSVEMDAGLWELVPSGSVDGSVTGPDGEIDLRGHLLTELKEEIGISEVEIAAPPRGNTAHVTPRVAALPVRGSSAPSPQCRYHDWWTAPRSGQARTGRIDLRGRATGIHPQQQ